MIRVESCKVMMIGSGRFCINRRIRRRRRRRLRLKLDECVGCLKFGSRIPILLHNRRTTSGDNTVSIGRSKKCLLSLRTGRYCHGNNNVDNIIVKKTNQF